MTALSALAAPATEALELRRMPRVAAATPEQARQTGAEFEQLFLAQMLSPMFEALPTDGPFGGGAGERMFRSLQIDEYARAIARNGGVGVAGAVTRELLALQEKTNG